ncbi:IclR family transcriptional regulator [Marinivivus vitaminiproducens]|uniref:IclR family transcriptional regulator n=1 Tax=Marinivivus vitaminiproducens TaxID=3035935 RepID=UPI00279FA65C|nr:IclR family transcriptional regulator [Geminicoccaceae bacterium SCSIO 64248]
MNEWAKLTLPNCFFVRNVISFVRNSIDRVDAIVKPEEGFGVPKISGETGDGIQSVVLTLRILEQIARTRDPVGVTQLATALGTTKTRIYRHLRTLVQEGYLRQSRRTERYQVGTQFLALGGQVAHTSDLSNIAQAPFRALRERLGQSCVLSQLEHAGARIVLTISGRSPIQIGVKPGSLLAFHNSAQGKVILAFADPALRERVLSGPLPAMTAKTITDRGRLEAELDIIRARGWAVAPDESAIGLNALAAPLIDGSGDVVGAIAIVDLTQFVPPEPSEEQRDAVLAAARAISAALGHAGDGD